LNNDLNNASNNTLIVGFGAPFGDDQFGWLVIEQLQKALDRQKSVKTICCDRSGIDWIHQYQPAEQLIFIDAVKSDAAPGTLHHKTLTPTAFDTLPATHSSHGISLREGIALATEVVKLPAEIEFYGVELAHCDANKTVSPITIQQVELVTETILKTTTGPRR